MDEIKINITTEDLNKASGYFFIKQCLLATALRRMFPFAEIEVYERMFYIHGEYYEFTVRHKIRAVYRNFKDGIKNQPFSFTAWRMN